MEKIKKLLDQRIKKLRKEKNLTQEQFAEKAHIDSRSLSHIECGDTFPTKCLNDIATALGMTISELCDFEHCQYDTCEMKTYIRENLDKISDGKIELMFRLLKALK